VTARAAIAGLALAITLLCGCSRGEPGSGPSARADGAPRIVSLSPSTTEAVFALGAGAALVGRTRHCDHPPEALAVPSVGGYADPDLEAVLGLRPTLVVGARGPAGPELERSLRAHRIETFFPPTESVAEVREMLLALGGRIGRSPEAERASAALAERVERVRSWAAARARVRVVVVFEASPLSVAGPGSYVGELVALAGGDNAVREGGPYPLIDVERLLVLDPDIIVDASGMEGGPSAGPRAGWDALRAVRTGRVRPLAGSAALRPGPRLGQGLADVARALHAEEPP
jgi:iron complex transport system substrate-binding protein